MTVRRILVACTLSLTAAAVQAQPAAQVGVLRRVCKTKREYYELDD